MCQSVRVAGVENADGSLTKFVPKADLDAANATIDRLSADCDRYMAERDEAVAQHDADAALIAELRAQVEASYAERSEPEPSLSWRLRATANRLSNASTDDRDYYHLVNDLIDEADRLERERSESAEREQRIEEAAKVACDAAAEPTGEASWVRAPEYYREAFRSAARALDEAGMLTGGDA
jgi:chromosome segregation ATPase